MKFTSTLLACLLSIIHIDPATTATASGELTFQVVDKNKKPIPCRIHLKNETGLPQRVTNHPFWRDHFVCPGTAELKLPAGKYTFVIERGPEYRRESGKFEIESDSKQTIEMRLTRLVNLAERGWYSGDLHVHRNPEDVPLLMRAEDLHVAPVISWWANRRSMRNLWADRELPSQTLTKLDGNRYYDIMAGEDEREAGALLYFHLNKPLSIGKTSAEYPSPMRYVTEARKNKNTWIDIEKPFWWDVPVWLASGKMDSIGLANNHMCHSTMYENEAWGKPRDEQRLPPPRGNGFWTQEIYYHILNSGLRIPPSAGSASGVLPNPVGYNRVYVHVGKEFREYDQWWEGLKAGRSFVTNGPLLICRANEELPGHVFQGDSGDAIKIDLKALLLSKDNVPKIEIIKNGKTVSAVSPKEANDEQSLGSIAFNTSGWFLVRAITDNKRTFRFASTAPYYVEIGEEKRRISKNSSQFFLNWVEERAARVPRQLEDAQKLQEVLEHHEQAKAFWRARVSKANAE